MDEDSLKIATLSPLDDLIEPAGPRTEADIRRQWLEARVKALYRETVSEAVPEALTALVMRLGRAH